MQGRVSQMSLTVTRPTTTTVIAEQLQTIPPSQKYNIEHQRHVKYVQNNEIMASLLTLNLSALGCGRPTVLLRLNKLFLSRVIILSI